ncbi:MAG: hypothetical protein ACNS61_02250 [Candidatus Wenzhouxiangella sp. M2_3B_020]
MSDLRTLLEQLRRGERPPLGPDDADALLGWLNGAAERDDGDLPRPGHDPVLLQMVFHRLDDVLFQAGELKLAAAGVDPDQPANRRRIRFRRLASAFHPDRFPDLSDWLTERSQAIHRAYAQFKKDPDAPAPQPVTPPRPPTAGKPVRSNPRRPRTQRLRHFADSLRARFGHDRYLAHKLIGGLAVLALLPVINLMLAPDPRKALESDDPVVGAASSPREVESMEEADPSARIRASHRSETGSAAEKDPVGAANSPRPAGPQSVGDGAPTYEIAESSAIVGADSGPQSTGTETNAAEEGDAVSPLLAAARRAMDPDSDGVSPPGTLPSVDAQLAAMGLETDAERLYRRMMEEEASSTVGAASRPRDAEDKEAETSARSRASHSTGSEPDEPSVGAANTPRQAGQKAVGDGAPTDQSSTAVGAASRPRDAEDKEADPSARGRASHRNESRPDPFSVGGDSDARSGATEEKRPSRPMRRVEPGSGVVPSVKSLMEKKEQSVPEPSARSRASHRDENKPGSSSVETANSPRQAGQKAVRDGAPTDQSSTAVGAASRPRDDQAEEAEPSARGRASHRNESRPDPSSVGAANSSRRSEPEASRTPPPSLPPGELTLGPLGSHPAGKLLAGFHRDLEAGNVAGIVSHFARDARLGGKRGQQEIAEHFSDLLAGADGRRVGLRVLRMARDGDRWQIEADLDFRVLRGGRVETVRSGRSDIVLEARGEGLAIRRVTQ